MLFILKIKLKPTKKRTILRLSIFIHFLGQIVITFNDKYLHSSNLRISKSQIEMTH